MQADESLLNLDIVYEVVQFLPEKRDLAQLSLLNSTWRQACKPLLWKSIKVSIDAIPGIGWVIGLVSSAVPLARLSKTCSEHYVFLT